MRPDAGTTATAATLSAFQVVRSFPLFLLVFCVYACCQGGLTSARQALLAGLVDEDRRTKVRAHLQSTLNAGLAIGTGLGGLALSVRHAERTGPRAPVRGDGHPLTRAGEDPRRLDAVG